MGFAEGSHHSVGRAGDRHNLRVRPDMERLHACNPYGGWVVVQGAAGEVHSLVEDIDQAGYTGHDSAAQMRGNRLPGLVVAKRAFDKDIPWDCKDRQALAHR